MRNLLIPAIFALVLTAIGFRPGWAEPPAAGDNDKKPDTAAKKEYRGDADVGPIRPVSSFLKTAAELREGKAPFTVEDVVLDLDLGCVVLWIVSLPGAEGKDPTRVAIPRPLAESTADGTLRLKVGETELKDMPSLETQWRDKTTRNWAVSIYQRLGADENWKPQLKAAKREDAAERKQAAADDLPAEGRRPLAAWSRLAGTRVYNGRGKELGQVADLAIGVHNGTIVYAALAESGLPKDELRQVPLSAFVAPLDKPTWLLELPQDVLENTPTFALKKWPQKVDAAWVEYVHVRYGRSPFEGVRSAPQLSKRKDQERR